MDRVLVWANDLSSFRIYSYSEICELLKERYNAAEENIIGLMKMYPVLYLGHIDGKKMWARSPLYSLSQKEVA